MNNLISSLRIIVINYFCKEIAVKGINEIIKQLDLFPGAAASCCCSGVQRAVGRPRALQPGAERLKILQRGAELRQQEID